MCLILWSRDKPEKLRKGIGQQLKLEQIPNRVADVVPPVTTLDNGKETCRFPLPDCQSGDLVLALGVPALQSLAQNKIVPKGRSITSLRNRLFPLPNGAVALVSYSADIEDVDHSKYIDLLTDVKLAIRWCRTGTLQPKLGNYQYVNDFSNAINCIRQQFKLIGKPVRVCLDTETLGLDPYSPEGYLISVQLTYKPGQADVVRFNSREESRAVRAGDYTGLWSQLCWLLTSPQVSLVGANFKYDQNWLTVQWGLPECTNCKFDTTLVGSLLDENRGNSLNVHAKVELATLGGYDDAFNQKHDKSRMDLALATDPDGFLAYAGGDTDACYQVADRFRTKLAQDHSLANFYATILHPAARAYESVERVGWHVDVPYMEWLRDELKTEIARLDKEARTLIGGRLIAKHRDRKTGLLNIGKASLLKDFMFSSMGLNLKPKMRTGKTDEPSTALDHLLQFDKDPKAKEFIAVLKEYNSACKTLSTYIVGFLQHLRSDGRFHPSYFMHSGFNEHNAEGGAVSGRLSVRDPAIQTIPSRTVWANRIRQAFIAPPGYVIVGQDYSQGELKITACLANEENMIDAYRKGIDLHSITASTLSGYKLDDFMALKKTDYEKWDRIRYLGKAGNFGLLYGMSPEGFKNYAKFEYGLELTDDEAEEKHSAFFKLYPGLHPWHDAYRNFARRCGFVRSPLGRVRHIPTIKSPDRFTASRAGRQAINSPVQSTLSDMSLWSAAILWKMGAFKVAPMFGMVHDAQYYYVPEDNWQFHVKQNQEVSENLPFEKLGWSPKLKFTVESKVGRNLGQLIAPEKFHP
jgi:DNA polymerase I-like protein with 3'-5' exonuclease and polymerase domains